MSSPRPVGRMRPSRKFCVAHFSFFSVVEVSYMVTTCSYCDNLELDIFDAGGLQCHFITFVTVADRIRTLSAH